MLKSRYPSVCLDDQSIMQVTFCEMNITFYGYYLMQKTYNNTFLSLVKATLKKKMWKIKEIMCDKINK